MTLLFSIIATALLFNIFKYFEKYKVNTLNAIVINYLIASVLSFIVPQSTPSVSYAFHQPWFFYTILLGFLFVTLFQLMAYASQKIDISTTTIANKITFIFPTAMGILFFNEAWNFLKILGFIVAIISIVLITEDKSKLPKSSGVLIILLLFFGGGMLESILNYSNQNWIEPNDTSLFFGYLFFFAFLFGVLMMIWKNILGHPLLSKKDFFWGTLLGIPNYLSMYFLLKSLDDYPSSSVFPIANMGVILCSTLLSVLLFKARISKKKAFALGCSILAIILISYFDIL